MTTIEILNKLFVPACLCLIMLGMGLGLEIADFKRLLKNPKSAVIGILGQLIMLPMLGFALTYLLPMPPEIAVGLIMLAACPGGVTSNAMVFIARGDTTLSVSLTAFNSLIAVFTVPFIISLGLQLHMGDTHDIQIDPWETMKKLSLICIFPVITGMIIRKLAPNFAEKSQPFFKRLSSLVLILLLTSVLVIQRDYLLANISQTWLATVSLNFGCMSIGYLMCRIAKVDLRQTVTLVIEIGLQNASLAILVATTLLQDTRLAITPSVYGVLSLITVGLFVIVISRHLNKPEA